MMQRPWASAFVPQSLLGTCEDRGSSFTPLRLRIQRAGTKASFLNDTSTLRRGAHPTCLSSVLVRLFSSLESAGDSRSLDFICIQKSNT